MSNPSQPQIKIKRKIFRGRVIAVTLLVLTASGLGFAVGWFSGCKTQPDTDPIPSDAIRTKPGPWGELYYIPFTISAPEEILPVRTMEAAGTHWFFKNFTREGLAKLLTNAGVPADRLEAFIAPAALHTQPNGIDLTPSFDAILSLPPEVRKTIYQLLAQFPENDAEIHFIHKSTVEDRMEGSGLSDDTLRIFRNLSCEYGDYLVFAGLSSMLSQLPSYEEKLRFVKALTRQKTMLFHLRVTPKSDIATMATYWGRGCYATDVQTILKSVSKLKGSAWIDILMLLPPIPSSQLYLYPVVQDNPLNGPPVLRDCMWTSFNFFRDTPDPKCSNPGYYLDQLKTNYAPAPGDPRYGDLVLFSKPAGDIIHSAVYLADDIVFTKNGSTAINPWMLESISDLLNHYSFQVSPQEKLTVSYYRNKSL